MCARFIGDNNSAGWKYESGTYANASGTEQWPGLVQSSDVVEEESFRQARFINGGSRDISQTWQEAISATGNNSAWVQDWRMLGFTLGSIVTTGSPYSHVLTAVNSDSSNGFTSGTSAPFISFSYQDSKKFNDTGLNHNKVLNGAMVDSLSIEWKEGEPVTMNTDMVGQNVTYSSGAPWAPTANTERPYLWSDTVFGLPSGTPIKFVKSATFKVNNNIVANNYINGSRMPELPYPDNRDYTFDLTCDASTEWAKTFYEQYYKGGSEFNLHIACGKSAVRKIDITLSGCTVNSCTDPSSTNGAQEMSIGVVPKTAVATVVDNIAKYGAW